MKDRRDFILTSSKAVASVGLSSLAKASQSNRDGKQTGLVYDDRYLKHTLSLRR
jgi:hypothetical protein